MKDKHALVGGGGGGYFKQQCHSKYACILQFETAFAQA